MYVESRGEYTEAPSNLTKIQSYIQQVLNLTHINLTQVEKIAVFSAKYYTPSGSSESWRNRISVENLLKWRYFTEITVSTVGKQNRELYINLTQVEKIAVCSAKHYTPSGTSESWRNKISVENLLQWRYFTEITVSTVGKQNRELYINL